LIDWTELLAITLSFNELKFDSFFQIIF